jgi:hypothetical protein
MPHERRSRDLDTERSETESRNGFNIFRLVNSLINIIQLLHKGYSKAQVRTLLKIFDKTSLSLKPGSSSMERSLSK